MRFLKLNDGGEFSLVEQAEKSVPEYATLSHTWGKDGEEVTYVDLINRTGEHKLGYKKLLFCGNQAKKDGLQYFWIDTCCIDRSSSAELSESINSMFRWYKNASKCYVYLEDVSLPQQQASNRYLEDAWGPAFRKSRWFTRGWTLQELIAPRSVEFFSKEGERLGDKKSLEHQLQEITGVSIHALSGEPLSHFSADERISWAAKRTTKLEEDKAYCLLGIFDVSLAAIYGEGGQRAFRRLVDEINKYSENNQLKKISDGSPTPPSLTIEQTESPIQGLWVVPFERNPRFTGREAELARLEQNLFLSGGTAKIAVTGLGGIGKTQLVIELIYRAKEKYSDCTVIWISATSMETLNQAYTDLAKQLAIPGSADKDADVKELVKVFLSTDKAGRWLLVFDNADDMDMWFSESESEQESHGKGRRLVDYLPKSKQGSIIFTTRNRKVAVKLTPTSLMAMPQMDERDAVQLLQNYLSDRDLVNEQQHVTALLQMLTQLPLAIAQAAAYINENGIALADYVALLEEQEEEVIDLLSEEFEDDGRYHDIMNPVATTWLISFEQIRRRDPLAVEYLSFMSCTDPKNFPQSLLPPGTTRKEETDAVGTLTAYSFITRRPADAAFDLHRLVHLAMRNWLRKEGRLEESTQKVIIRLEEVFPDDDPSNRSIWRTYLPHVNFVLKSDVVDKENELTIVVMWRYGMCQHSDGQWIEAERAFDQVWRYNKEVLGPEHPDTLRSLASLASTLGHRGLWDKAEELEKQVVEICKRVLGPEHPETLTCMSNLAETYRNKGLWDKSQELCVQVMDIRQRELGPEHPDTLNSLSELATIYRSKGQWDKAEGLEVQVMEIRTKALGPEHVDTLTSMNNLALTLVSKGQWDKAGELAKQVMEARKKVLGPDHLGTLVSISSLAFTFGNKGLWDKAEELEVQVVEGCTRMFGPEHPDTLTSIANLALTYRYKGSWDKAEELTMQAMETRKRLLGPEHPDTLTSMYALSLLWREMGRRAEGLKLMDECVRLRVRILGANHPYAIAASESLREWQLEDEGLTLY